MPPLAAVRPPAPEVTRSRPSRDRLGPALLLALALLLQAGCRAPTPADERRPVEDGGSPLYSVGTKEWYAANEPIVKAYLSTLPDRAIGHPIGGIRLSDGGRWFEGSIYLGHPANAPPGVRATILASEEQTRAYLWLEEGTDPLSLPVCEGEDAGIRVRRLGGAVLQWRQVRAEHGVVYSTCPPPEWIPARPEASSAEEEDAATED